MNADRRKTIVATIPNSLDYLPIVLNAVRHCAALANFEERETTQLELGVEEAVANVIKHAYLPGESGEASVKIEQDALGLRVIVHDMGEPFDPDLLPRYSPEETSNTLNAKGLGLFLMRKFVDESEFRNLGRHGHETVLYKYRRRGAEEHESSTTVPAVEEEVLLPGLVEYTVRRMKQEEAVDVSKCAYGSYGYTYVYENIYFPDRVRSLNASGEIMSFVAVTTDGEVIGHSALAPQPEDAGVAEMGVSFVKPKYRGQGCLKALSAARLEAGKVLGLTGVFMQAVTTHPFSQKPAHNNGFNDCALMLARVTPIEFKNIEQPKPQRESLVVSFKYLCPPDVISVYLPTQYKAVLSRTYESLGIGLNILTSAENVIPNGGTSMLSAKTDAYNGATIAVKECGADFPLALKRMVRSLCLDRVSVIYLAVPLSCPFIEFMVSISQNIGFFYCGTMPGSGERNMLLMQFLNNCLFDFSIPILDSDNGKFLLEYIEQDYMRTQA